MSEQSGYNGWSNYETWCVNLWMSNDAGSDSYFNEMAQEIWNESEAELRADESVLFTRDEVATRVLAERFKEHHEEALSQIGEISIGGVFSDLLNAALGEVDWYEIAGHYIADVDKDEEK